MFDLLAVLFFSAGCSLNRGGAADAAQRGDIAVKAGMHLKPVQAPVVPMSRAVPARIPEDAPMSRLCQGDGHWIVAANMVVVDHPGGDRDELALFPSCAPA